LRAVERLFTNTLTEFFVPVLVLIALQNFDAPADTVLRVPLLVIVAVLYEGADAPAQVEVPNLVCWTDLFVADALAKLITPVEPS
jgi:hypothetical protein